MTVAFPLKASASPSHDAQTGVAHRVSSLLPSAENRALTIAELVADLRAPEYAVREDATMMLMRMGAERLSDIVTASDAEKNEEARARLIRVAVHLRMKRETLLTAPVDSPVDQAGGVVRSTATVGAVDAVDGQGTRTDEVNAPATVHRATAMLGMVFNPELMVVGKDRNVRMTIAANFLQPGFPAAEVLEPGDRLVAIDGNAFPLDMSTDTFRSIIQSRVIGAMMRFTIIRNGKEMEVGVRTAGVPAEAVGNLEGYVAARLEVSAAFAEQLRRQQGEDVVVMGASAGQEIGKQGN